VAAHDGRLPSASQISPTVARARCRDRQCQQIAPELSKGRLGRRGRAASAAAHFRDRGSFHPVELGDLRLKHRFVVDVEDVDMVARPTGTCRRRRWPPAMSIAPAAAPRISMRNFGRPLDCPGRFAQRLTSSIISVAASATDGQRLT
jgi:hypothetical protein